MLTFQEYLKEWSEFDSGIRTQMKKKGYKFLGYGADQQAYLAPDGKTVLKIFGHGSHVIPKVDAEFSADHLLFARFAEYCKKHPSNPFLPKVYGWEPFVFQGYTYIQYKTELLLPVKTALTRDFAEALALLATAREEWHKDPKEFADTFKDQKLHTVDYWYVRSEALKDAYAMMSIHLGHRVDLFLDTLQDLIQLGKKYRYVVDLHSSNFMVNLKGDIVFADPWVLSNSRRSARDTKIINQQVWGMK